MDTGYQQKYESLMSKVKVQEIGNKVQFTNVFRL